MFGTCGRHVLRGCDRIYLRCSIEGTTADLAGVIQQNLVLELLVLAEARPAASAARRSRHSANVAPRRTAPPRSCGTNALKMQLLKPNTRN